jgi:hypothetical protein
LRCSKIAQARQLPARVGVFFEFSVHETSADWTVYGTFCDGLLLFPAILFLKSIDYEKKSAIQSAGFRAGSLQEISSGKVTDAALREI